MVACGVLVPAHLRAVSAAVIQKAGLNTPTLVGEGLELVREEKSGPAQMLLQTAQDEQLRDRDKLGFAIGNLTVKRPATLVWGGPEPRLEKVFATAAVPSTSGSETFTRFLVRLENREKALQFLAASQNPVVSTLLRSRSLTNTVLFSPSLSSSGQAFDTAVAVVGLLLEEGQLTKGLSDTILALAAEANRGGNPQRLEQVLLDFMSLGQRFNYEQLVAFTGRIDDAETLRLFADQARQAGRRLPRLFAVGQFSGRPADVAKYLVNFSQTGLTDLASSLRYGAGGVTELLRRNQRLYRPWFQTYVEEYEPFAAFFDFAGDWCRRAPGPALGVKWFFYLTGGFLIAIGLHFARPAVSALEEPLQVRGFHVAREILFALGFLLVVLLLSEPFLSQDSQKVEVPFRFRLPVSGRTTPAGITSPHSSIMNQLSLLTLLLFFVLQALIYVACLVKLAEIRRQKVLPRVKLKLLENEDHLFDAGLYLGFAGTIISLILVSLGVIKPSLMAAYSSTSFGIIFVSVFKIFHLRPARRILLLESESVSPEPATRSAAATLATHG